MGEEQSLWFAAKAAHGCEHQHSHEIQSAVGTVPFAVHCMSCLAGAQFSCTIIVLLVYTEAESRHEPLAQRLNGNIFSALC